MSHKTDGATDVTNTSIALRKCLSNTSGADTPPVPKVLNMGMNRVSYLVFSEVPAIYDLN